MAGAICDIAECVAALPGDAPTGSDALDSAQWPELTEARREEAPDPSRIDRKVADWRKAEELAGQILAHQSKDLRVAIFLLEAKLCRHGFVGLRDGLFVLRSLIEHFWEIGLHPSAQYGDQYERGRPLIWLEDRLPLLLIQMPLTGRESGPNYSFVQFEESKKWYFQIDTRGSDSDGGLARRQQKDSGLARGETSNEMFESAVKATRAGTAERIQAQFKDAAHEFAELEKVLKHHVVVRGDDGTAVPLGLSEVRKRLESIGKVLDDIVRQTRKEQPGPAISETPSAATINLTDEQPPRLRTIETSESPTPLTNGNGWAHAEHLVRDGQIEQALAEMTRLAAAEHGRVRFQRRLTLAEICLDTKREKLAAVILEELDEQIKNLQLEQWESPELICRVWGNLYRYYQREEGSQEKATALYRQLCRLDPWQAVQWEG